MLKTLQKTGQESAISKSIINKFRNTFFDSITFSEEQANNFWPKKGKVFGIKLKNPDDRKYQLVTVDKENSFMHVEDYVIPPLKLVHSYPDMYPKFQVDEGAVKFVLKGANVMSPGLLNQQAHMDDVQEGAIVAIYAHGHEHALGIGVAKKSTQQIKTEKQGVAVELIHYLGDGFWNYMYKK